MPDQNPSKLQPSRSTSDPRDEMSEEVFAWVVTDTSELPEVPAEGSHASPDDVPAGDGSAGNRQLMVSAPALARHMGIDVSDLHSEAGRPGAEAGSEWLQSSGLLPVSPVHSGLSGSGQLAFTHALPSTGSGHNVGHAVIPPVTSGTGSPTSGHTPSHIVTGGQPNGPAIAGLIPGGKEGEPLPVLISVVNGNNKPDGLSLTIGGLPPGTSMNHGHQGPGGTWVLSPGTDLVNLTMTPPTDWFGSGHLTATVVQPNGNSVQAQIPFNVLPQPDAARIAGTDIGTATEDRILTVSGALTIIDPDPGEAHFLTTSLSGNFGRLQIDASGHWNYVLDNNTPSVQALVAGQSERETFTVHSVDGTAHQLVVNVLGTDDLATIAGTGVGTVTEDKLQSTGGKLDVTDPDAGQASFVPQPSAAGAHGSFTVQPDGTWSYSLDNGQPAVQALKTGDQITDTLTVSTVDGTTKQITVTINGTDDKAAIAGTGVGTVTEDKLQSTGGKLDVTDPDAGQASFVPQPSAAGAHGSFTVQPDGTWSYSLDNGQPAVQALKTGDQITDTLTVSTVDGTTKQITVTINGTDDKAAIAGTGVGTVTEDKLQSTGGKLDVTDPDAGQASFVPQPSAAGAHGSFTVQPDGTWSYSLDNGQPAVQALKTGDQITDTLTVSTVDGTTKQITVTINGTDDKAAIAGTGVGTVTEDKLQSTGGKLDVTDPDAGQASFVPQPSAAGAHGSFTVQPDGTWSYSLDNGQPAVQALKTGDQITDTLTVSTVDGTTKQITVTINGTDDKAAISGVDTGSATENTAGADKSPDYAHPGIAYLNQAPLYVDGKLTIIDPDAGENSFDTHGVGYNYSGKYGDLMLQGNGAWHYIGNAGNVVKGGVSTTHGTAIDQLGEGQTLTDTITVHSKDGTPHDIVITIHGSNDRPYCSSEVLLPSGTEDTRQTLTTAQLLQNSVDVDANDAGKLAIANMRPDHGSILDNGDGTFTFTPDKDYNGPVHFTYDVTDAHGGVTHTGATTALAAVGDAAVITGTDTGSSTEDKVPGRIVITGDLDVTDPDGTGQEHFQYSQFGEHAVSDPFGGSLHISSAGNWSYVTNNSNMSVQQLTAGQVGHVTYRVASADGTTHQIQITIHGTNDAPVLSAATASAIEDGSAVSGQMVAMDVDTGDTASYATAQPVAGLTLGADGAWSFDPTDAAYQHLAAGQTQKVTIPVTVTDSAGATDTQNLIITINGTDDKAAIAGVDTGSVTENAAGVNMSPNYAQPGISHLNQAPLYVDGKLTIIDPDAGENSFDTHGVGYNYSGKYGDLMLQGNGAWHYIGNAGNVVKGGVSTKQGTAIDQLGEGQTLTDTITVHSKDGTPHDIVITIHGSNDRPYCSSEVLLPSGTEDTRQTLTTAQLLQNSVDVDANDAGKLAIANMRPDHGSILDNGDGTFTFTPDKDYNGPVHFTYDVTDAHGGVTHTGATTALAAVGDAAVITGVGASLKEDVGVGSGSGDPGDLSAYGQFHVVDPDGAAESKFPDPRPGFQTYTGSLGGRLQVNPDGQYIYHLKNSIVDHLKTGEEAKDSFVIHSVDGTTHPVEFTVAGTNDAPVVYRNLVTKFEGENVFNGHISAGDLDHDDSTSLTFTSGAPVAGFNLNSDGSYTFDPSNAAYRGMNDGDHRIISVPVTVTDADGLSSTGSLRVQLLGRNDAPVLSSATASATEDGNAVSGQMSATDVDGSYYTRQYSLGQTAPAGFVLNADGSWSFDPTDAAYQHLSAGATQQVTIPVTVTDKQGATDTENLVITVTGSNDGPVVHAGDLGATQPGASRSLSASDLLAAVHATDVDTGDQLSISNVQVDPQYGSFHQSGSNWIFTPAAGAGHTDVPVTVSVTDGHATSSATTTLDVTALALAPPTATQVHGAGTTHLSGILTGSAGGWTIDNGGSHGVLSLQGQYGTLTIDPTTGHFEYHYQSQSGVIKHGGSAATSGHHTDTFHILQHGTHTSDADVEVNIDVQSTHGNSGHHVDSTTLLGINIVPVQSPQHDVPSDEGPILEVTLDADTQDPTIDTLGLTDDIDASLAAGAGSADKFEVQDSKAFEASEENSGQEAALPDHSDPMNVYLNAVGANVDSDVLVEQEGAELANPYTVALGVDAVVPVDDPMVDPTMMDDTTHSEDWNSQTATGHEEVDLPVDEPLVPLSEDDDPSTNSG